MDEVVSVSTEIDYTELLQTIIANQQTIISYLEPISNLLSGSFGLLLVVLGLAAALVVLLVIYNFMKHFMYTN